METDLAGNASVTKNHQRREPTVPAFVVKLLREHLARVPDDPDAFTFPGRQQHTANRQQSYHGFRRRFLQAVTAAGLPEFIAHSRPQTHCEPAGWPPSTLRDAGCITADAQPGYAFTCDCDVEA